MPVPSELIAALSDDLNTHEAITVLRSYAKQGLIAELKVGMNFLGIKPMKVAMITRSLEDHSNSLIRLRNEAICAKNFVKADLSRDRLAAVGISVKDSPDGTKWKAFPLDYKEVYRALNNAIYRDDDFDIEKFEEMLNAVRSDPSVLENRMVAKLRDLEGQL